MSEEAQQNPISSISFLSKCLGISILVVALAGSYRVVTGKTGVTITGNMDGFEINLEQARQELKQASAEISGAQDQVKAQAEDLEKASEALAAREARLNELVATLQKQAASALAVTPDVKSGLSELNQARATKLVKVRPPVDSSTFRTVENRLSRIDELSKKLVP